MLNIGISKKAGQLGRLVKHSAMAKRTGRTHRPVLAAQGQMGVTFIGHSSFFLQVGGANVVIDPIFAPWLFVLKRLRRPGLRIQDLPPLDAVLVTHAHFDHLHRPSLRAIARATRIKNGRTPLLIVPDNVTDLVFDLGFERIVELKLVGGIATRGDSGYRDAGQALGGARHSRHASRLWRLLSERRRPFDLSLGRHRLLWRLS